MTRPIPYAAVSIIESFEGLRTHAYQDSDGEWTIGYGETRHVKRGDTISKEQAEEELREYLQSIGPILTSKVRVPLNSNQFSALLSLCYNIGIGNFEKSELLKVINERKEDRIIPEFMVWIRDHDGEILPGLKARRFAEASLYFQK